jgi:hypothetical protein
LDLSPQRFGSVAKDSGAGEHGFFMVIAEEADCEPEDFLTISLIFCQEIFSKN